MKKKKENAKKIQEEFKEKSVMSLTPEEIEKLKALMKRAQNNLDFEKCIEIRDTIAKLKLKIRS